MIARVLALGRSFKKLVSYLKTGKDGRQLQRDRVEWVEFRNLPTCNPDTAACMMASTASESVSGTQTAVYHFSISCDPGDPVDGGTLRRVADRTIRDLGLEEHQVLIFAHKDRAHPHLHFVVNRVHPQRHTLWRSWRDYYRIERSLRAQEQEMGLQIVPGWNSVVVRAADGGLRVPEEHETGLQRVFPRRNQRPGDSEFLREVIVRATPVMEQARSWMELEHGLAEQGLSLRAKGGGFTLTDGIRQVKASEVGRGCSRHHLEKRLGGYPDYRARVAVAEIPPASPTSVVQPVAARPQRPDPTETQTSAQQQEPSAPVPARSSLQFGDAGHGIQDLFNDTEPREVAPAPAAKHSPDPQRQPKARSLLREAQERAGPVLERASSWVEVERGLADHGLLLREKGGGFVVTDGQREVKASQVGRAFSRSHLENRLGLYPGTNATPALPALAEPSVPGASPSAPMSVVVPPAVPPPPALEPRANSDRGRGKDVQLAIPFEESSAPAAPIAPAQEPAQPVQLGLLPFTDSPAPPRRRESRPSASPAHPLPEAKAPEPRPVPSVPQPGTPEPTPAPAKRFWPARPPAPRRVRHDPPTDVDMYREVVGRLRTELARLYRDPRAARRTFDTHLALQGRAQAVRTMLEHPETFGNLRLSATPERIAEAVRWADLYADWHHGSLRPLRAAITDLLNAADVRESVRDRAYAAREEFQKATQHHTGLERSTGRADSADQEVRNGSSRLYCRPTKAIEQIEAYRAQNGTNATVDAIRYSPEQFGRLTGPGWFSRVLNGTGVGGQRTDAVSLSSAYSRALAAEASRPSPEELAAAERAIRDAECRMNAADARWMDLSGRSSEGYVREAARLARQTAVTRSESVDHVLRRIAPRLASSALSFAVKVLEAVHEQEQPQQQRDAPAKGPGVGF